MEDRICTYGKELGQRSLRDAKKEWEKIQAWTFRAGMTAPQAAGVPHTDFERGVVRAQTIGCDKLLETGSLVETRNKRWLRSEGEGYEVEEGDVMESLFNV